MSRIVVSRFPISSTLLKALSLRYGLRKALEYSHQNLIAESDSQILIKALNGDLCADAYPRLILGDILSLAYETRCSGFLFAHRDTNQLAHSLAHYGNEDDFEKIWVEELPLCCNSLNVPVMKLNTPSTSAIVAWREPAPL
ncbi:hypothetical protein ACS0TY_000882 [Phlomoides rotata]